MIKRLLLILIASSLFLTACDDDDDATPDAPQLPNLGVLQLPTAAFAPADDAGQGWTAAAGLINNSNSAFGAVQLTFSQMLAPAANVNPSYSNDVFTWEYPVSLTAFGGASFDLEFQANVSNPDNVTVELRATGTFEGLPLDNFLLLTGSMNSTATEVQLVVDNFQTPGGEIRYDIDWQYAIVDGALAGMQATQILLNPGIDSNVENVFGFGISGSTATFNGRIGAVGEDPQVGGEVVWDVNTGAGSITIPGMGQLCWDADRNDVAC